MIVPVPLYQDGKFDMQCKIINDKLPGLVDNIAHKLNIPSNRIIKTFTPFGGNKFDKSGLFADGCHPNDAGYQVLAELVHKALDLK